ncbi:phage tail tube protein [Streptomyces albicerus]|uniref:phage tail tube protein n=1 Tax=Streptomyces albicerus TaxID=2569859 RepID=UPI00124B01F4|nr:hypothetical protein [Streptomyces albicerus]
MAIYDARAIEFEIEDPDAPGTWVPIGEINTLTITTGEEVTPTTVFGSQGQAESQKMEINKQFTLQGQHDPADAGQALVAVLAARLSEASLGGFRFAYPGDTVWKVWKAHVTLGEQGGGNNAKGAFAATFTRSGADTTAVKA